MDAPSDRRKFLRIALGTATFLPLYAAAAAAHSASITAALSVEYLTANMLLITGSGCNVVALKGSDGILMVDGGGVDGAAQLLKVIRQEFTAAPVRILFNTHWHPEHVGCNVALGRSGCKILAHENTRLWLGTEVNQTWLKRVVKPLPPQARPNSTFYTSGKFEFAGEQVEYGHLGQAHTDGDIYVFFRKANVLLAGGVLAVGSYPISDYVTGGWIGGTADAAQRLVDLADDKTRLVPALGPVQNRADVVAEQQMLAKSKDILWQLVRKGFAAEDMIEADALREFAPRWGNSDLFIQNAYQGMYGHVREIGGVV